MISGKYGIDSSEFFDSFVDAWKNQESICGSLWIKCRKRTKDSAVFLITSGYRVVAQLSMPKRILRYTNPLREFTRSLGKPSVEEAKVSRLRIRDLRPGMKRINLRARVLEIPKPRLVFTKFGTQAYVANALVTDETGAIKLSLWNQQINEVSVGDVVQIENAHVATFRGEPQLRMGRHGKLSVVEDTDLPARELKLMEKEVMS